MVVSAKVIDDKEIENEFNEDFDISIDKRGDELSVKSSGDDSKEVLDFARCLFGDNFDSFDCDFDECQEEEKYECEPAEFDYEEAEVPVDDVDSEEAFEMDFDPEEREIEVKAEEEAPEETKEGEPEKEEEERPQMDMVDGKLVRSDEHPDAGFEDEEDIDESFTDEELADDFAEALKKKDHLTEASLKDKIKALKAKWDLKAVNRALNKIFKFRVKEVGKDDKDLRTYEAKDIFEAEKLAVEASKKADVEKALVVAVDYTSAANRNFYKQSGSTMLNIGLAENRDLILETFRSGLLSTAIGESDVRYTVLTELEAVKATNKAKEVPAEKTEDETNEISKVEDQRPEEATQEDQEEDQELSKKRGDVLNRKVKRNKAIINALKDAGYNTDDLANGRKATDKLNKLRKDIFGESIMREGYIPASEEEQKLWDRLDDENCGPNYEYELEYNPEDDFGIDTTVERDSYERDYDGGYSRKSNYIDVGRYNMDWTYYAAITCEDVLAFLGLDHLTEEGVERFLADDAKKQDSEFTEFLKERYADKASKEFQEQLDAGDLDDDMDWDQEWSEPDYD